MTSKFIEGSKHAEWSALVEKHFAGGNVGQRPGTDPLLRAPPGGSTAWNPPSGPLEQVSDINSDDESPAGPSMFNASNPPRPRETGVNYQPHSHVGNTVKDDPFQGNADGMPGNAKKIWK